MKIQIIGGKVYKTIPSNVLPLHLKQIFPHIIWIFTEAEGDGIESRLPFKILHTKLLQENTWFPDWFVSQFLITLTKIQQYYFEIALAFGGTIKNLASDFANIFVKFWI